MAANISTPPISKPTGVPMHSGSRAVRPKDSALLDREHNRRNSVDLAHIEVVACEDNIFSYSLCYLGH